MIKYEIKLGAKYLNSEARGKRDEILKPQLRGMHCRKCTHDTIIEFVEIDQIVSWHIHACCYEFEKRIKDKLNDFTRRVLRQC